MCCDREDGESEWSSPESALNAEHPVNRSWKLKIIDDCWSDIETYNCQYGAHVFENSTAKIYVNQWLAPSKELYELFYRKNDEGFAGHCLLVFEGVRKFDLSVTLHHKSMEGKLVVRDPVHYRYIGEAREALKQYDFEGSLHGFPSSVSISIEAQRFSLHVLEKDEPARQS